MDWEVKFSNETTKAARRSIHSKNHVTIIRMQKHVTRHLNARPIRIQHFLLRFKEKYCFKVYFLAKQKNCFCSSFAVFCFFSNAFTQYLNSKRKIKWGSLIFIFLRIKCFNKQWNSFYEKWKAQQTSKTTQIVDFENPLWLYYKFIHYFSFIPVMINPV